MRQRLVAIPIWAGRGRFYRNGKGLPSRRLQGRGVVGQSSLDIEDGLNQSVSPRRVGHSWQEENLSESKDPLERSWHASRVFP